MPSSPEKREQHRRYNANRPAHHSLYKTPAWRAKAKAQLEAEPWCRFCAQRGVRTKARIADHIEAHRGDRTKFWCGALQSLCRPCDSRIKQSLERSRTQGCDESGLPVDPSHPWST